MKNSSFRKGLVFGLIIVSIGFTALPSTVGTINENKSFRSIKSRGFIQDLIDNASDGDTINIPNGTYYEHIIIDKSINLVGENPHSVIIDGSGSGECVSITADWVNISGFAIAHGDIGIYVHSEHSCFFNNNIVENNEEGIFLTDSNYNVIEENYISENEDGIELEDSNDNFINDNIISSNKDYGLEFHASSIDECKNNIILNNFIDYNDLGVYLDISSNNFVWNNFILSNLKNGIYLYDSSGNEIAGNFIAYNSEGIFLDLNFEANIIEGNIIRKNRLGLALNMSNNNIISNNFISSNSEEGIFLLESTGNEISGNNISFNEDGVELEDSGYNHITNNTISLNSDYGLEFQGSSKEDYIQNLVDYNTIKSNNVGILLINSSFNLFTKNNFFNNGQNAFFNSCKNSWKQNYWNRPRIFPKLIFGKIKFGPIFIPWINVDWRPAKEPYENNEVELASVVVRVNNSKIRITLTTGGDNMPSTGYLFENMVTIRLNGTALSENKLEGNIGWEVGESLYIGGSIPTLDDEESAVGKLSPGSYFITVIIIETVIFDDVIIIE